MEKPTKSDRVVIWHTFELTLVRTPSSLAAPYELQMLPEYNAAGLTEDELRKLRDAIDVELDANAGRG